MAIDIQKLKSASPPKGMDFHIGKLGHIVSAATAGCGHRDGVKSLEEAIAHPVPGQDAHLAR